MKEKLKEWKKSEKEKMAGMDKKQKREYILTYYKGWFIFGAVLIFFLIWIPYHYIYSRVDVSFNCAVVNGVFDTGDIEMSDRLKEYFGFSSRKEYVYFDTEYQISYPGVVNNAGDVSLYDKFFLNIRMGSMDAAVMPESFLDYCNQVEPCFYDVRDVLDAGQIEKYEPYFKMLKDENGEEYAAGIDISHFKIWEEENFSFVGENIGEEKILAFPNTGKNMELCRKFIGFLNGGD